MKFLLKRFVQGRKLRYRDWEIEGQKRGFIIRWTYPDGREVASFPVVKSGIPIPGLFYPYMLWNGVKAIRQLRRAFKDEPPITL